MSYSMSSHSTEQFDNAYAQLNTEQRQAVDTIEGPLLVLAGPGSGKTELLSVRVANILRQSDAYPHSILCLTFTDSAAVNMRQRLRSLIGADAYKVQIHTFHSFAVDVIERYPEYFYNGARFSAADELVQRDILEQLFSELPHDNSLAVMHPDQGYVYLRDVKNNITHCKRAGITPEQLQTVLTNNTAEIEQLNPIVQQYFDARVTKSLLTELPNCIAELQAVADGLNHDDTISSILSLSLSQRLAETLQTALTEANDLNATGPISEWKRTYVKKIEVADGTKQIVVKDTAYQEKLATFAELYAEYRKALFKGGFYDFDDMIMDVLQALREHEQLRYELQEQYLYMLVDEFQDTNDAQLNLLQLLTNNEHTDSPNVMAVGDDDQAIYKFQGAELKNMLHFIQQYPDTTVVTLRQNYRSTAPILELSQQVIKHNTQRLSEVLPNIEKELVANIDTLDSSDIVHELTPTAEHEYYWIAEEISNLIEGGADPEEIAVITRNHKQLRDLVPFLQSRALPMRYDRQQDVFTQPHVYQLIQLSKFIVELTRGNQAEVDELLPEILSYPFLELDRALVWEIAVAAKKTREHWITIMAASEHTEIVEIANWFQELSKQAEHEPLSFMVDALIDGRFKDYYFSEQKYHEQPQEYISFLSSLRVFMQAIKDHKPDQFLRLNDLVTFVFLHKKNNISLTDTSAFINSASAVQLLTAHKAKGLEFHTVFVMSCQEHVWMKRGKTSLIPMPLNLPITPERDSTEDQLRLLYVALTRAKHRLYITSYQETDTGREAERIRVLPDYSADSSAEENTVVLDPQILTTNVLANAWEQYHVQPLVDVEETVLKEVVKNYQMSVTHLNNFLDVSSGGPQKFLLQNLLRFPQAKQAPGAYGTAVHSAIEQLYIQLRTTQTLPSKEQFIEYFIETLQREEMRKRDRKHFQQKGEDALAVYYESQQKRFAAEHIIEANFAKQGVLIGEAHLSGKIDKMVPVSDTEYSVVDFKTGKAFAEWKGKSAYDKIKLHNYKRQLIFYKLLVENSSQYSKFTVNTGVLEFVEPNTHGEILLLEHSITEEDVARLRKLIEVVYSNIINLEFPDISEFSEDIDGVIAFEDSLLE